jgi:predicted phosphodiesterase
MRIAALYDIHGNLPALESVLRDVRTEGVDLVVVGGDVVPGPMPVETIDCLLSLAMPVRFIRGNGDRVVAAAWVGGDIAEVPEGFRDVVTWNAARLSAAHRDALSSWETSVTSDVEGLGATLFCHATPRSDTEIITTRTGDARLSAVFEGCQSPTIICGHTHVQFDRTAVGRRIVNAGSVGMPFQQPAGAYWALLGPGVELRRTAYDTQQAADAFRATRCPQVEAVAVRYALSPPTAEESLAMFASAERR